MRFYSTAAVLIGATLLMGCQNKRPDPSAVSSGVSSETLRAIRESYQRIDPAARVGRVIAVKPEFELAAVGDIPLDDFNRGDPLTFVNANQEVLVHGTVIHKTADALHVRYQPPQAGQRPPQVGDLAVRFK